MLRSAASPEAFQRAVDTVPKLKDDPGNEVKLQLYALFKQASTGQCNTPKPGMMDFVGKAKHEAWSKLGSMSQDEARTKYVETVEKLVKEIGLEGGDSSDSNTASGSGSVESLCGGDILMERSRNVLTIKLNRPNKFNAITSAMYETITATLNNVGNEKDIKAVVIMGEGQYYSSGNDLSNFISWASNVGGGNLKEALPQVKARLVEFVDAFINCPKALIAAVNGPAFGVMATTLALCDMVLCSESAVFKTPFTSLGQSPEGCSTVTFPLIMGKSRASQMLLFNAQMTAKEAYECGFVSKLAPADRDGFLAALEDLLHGPQGIVPNCYPQSLIESKKLVRTPELKAYLHKVNEREGQILIERFESDECAQAVSNFLNKSKKK